MQTNKTLAETKAQPDIQNYEQMLLFLYQKKTTTNNQSSITIQY